LESVIIDDVEEDNNIEEDDNTIKIPLHFRSPLLKTNLTVKTIDGLNINS